ncbi:hypothetical protein [Helcobacillus massiliensis]|uniref:Uncharacterized protein n=2 Tax=Helcobacillus massiliensis TaxID=521392 RepID=A0A839R263_9MICO|nr:hypothetical protein [Helcobacillus massiliensis]MBB3022816.1 hypothetical protein [Helcobacillus massiliensis]
MTTDQILARLAACGITPVDPTSFAPEDDDPFFILTDVDDDGVGSLRYVLAYDAEMIDDKTAYTDWIHEWARATDRSDAIGDVQSHVDFDGGASFVQWSLNGTRTRVDFEQEGDWIHPDAADAIIDQLGSVEGRTRLFIDNGQGGVYAWVLPGTVDQFTELFPEAERA